MDIRFYLSVFPTEAFIASQLDPKQFGTYMATGSKKGSAEQIIFCEVTPGFDGPFDWEYAKEKCVPHSYGDPKHSVYLSVYRVLEHVPIDSIESMFLTTRDGRTLELKKDVYIAPDNKAKGFYVYQELCPVPPVIVSRLAPAEFGEYMTNPDQKVSMPKIIFADLKIIDFDHPDRTGNIGSIYDRKIPHLLECIAAVTSDEEKTNKTLTRTHIESFSFQTINNAVYTTDGKTLAMYSMPNVEELKKIDYDWGRSALIL
jgi:hypothetical protein